MVSCEAAFRAVPGTLFPHVYGRISRDAVEGMMGVNETQTAPPWGSRWGHERRGLDRARSRTSPDPVSGPAVVGRLTHFDLLVCSRCVLLCPDAPLTSHGLILVSP